MLNEDIVLEILRKTITDIDMIFDDTRIYEDFKPLVERNYLEKYRPIIENIIRDKVNVKATNEDFNAIVALIEKVIYSDYTGSNYTGIVIAGYGENDYFPKLYQTEIFLCLDGILKVKEYNPAIIDKNNNTAELRPFAQHDMVDTFMRGIDPSLNGYIKELVVNILDEVNRASDPFKKEESKDAIGSIIDRAKELFLNELERKERIEFISPIIEMVASLGKKQMAEMAETLIELTSFKRKISMDTESVGGPVDIAVISKSEGFIWIKRKYYFEREFNPSYIERGRLKCPIREV